MTESKVIKNSDKSLEQFQEYFKIGVSDEFILIRNDFPMKDITPSDFSRLCREMFKKNDEACNAK